MAWRGSLFAGPRRCDFDPVTGKQYERFATYFVACDRSAAKPTKLVVSQNNTNDCHYYLNFSWAGACASNVPPPPPPPSTCVHGTVTSGKCVCETGWEGSMCNESSLVCSIGTNCNTCSACCASYGSEYSACPLTRRCVYGRCSGPCRCGGFRCGGLRLIS